MADSPNNSIPAAKPLSGPLSGLYKTSTEIAKDAVSQMKQIRAADAAQNALEGYTKGLDGIYTPVADLAKSVGNKLMEMAAANPATAAAAEKVAAAAGVTKDAPGTTEKAGTISPTDQSSTQVTPNLQTTIAMASDAWDTLKNWVKELGRKQEVYSPNASYNRLTDAERQALMEMIWLSSGNGNFSNTQQTFMTALDQYPSASFVAPNRMIAGPTFITRPRLCLQSSNLRGVRTMLPLDTTNTRSTAFAIRCLLDTNLHKIRQDYRPYVTNCPLHDPCNPFLVPLCNGLTSISGFPDFSINTSTTDGGYFMEAQQFASGYDAWDRGTNSLSLTFRDIQNGPIFALFWYWLEYIRHVTLGNMKAYADDIDSRRLNYTVSIYQFVLDPSGHYITHFAKATGCFPTSLPIGGIFNKGPDTYVVTELQTLSIPFVANVIEYDDYAILMDFNNLVRRYCPSIDKKADDTSAVSEPNEIGVPSATLHPRIPGSAPMGNFTALPWISSDPFGYRLEWRQNPNPAMNQEIWDKEIKPLVSVEEQRKALLYGQRYIDELNYRSPSFYREAVNPQLSGTGMSPAFSADRAFAKFLNTCFNAFKDTKAAFGLTDNSIYRSDV